MLNAIAIGFIVYIVAGIVCNAIYKARVAVRAAKVNRKSTKEENALAIVSNDYSAKDDIKKQCLTEQLLFVEDLLTSETNPEKTLKYMKEKQRILTALADL